MGSFFTNVHVRVPDGVAPGALADRRRAVAEQQLVDEGFAITAGPADREILIVPAGRWLAFYDARTEDQDDRISVWARDISAALETDAAQVVRLYRAAIDAGQRPESERVVVRSLATRLEAR
jgi:hypothetical protein